MQLPNGDKVFSIEYIFSDKPGIVKKFMTYAGSRKFAENKTRDLERPHHINVIRINQIPSGQDFEDVFAIVLEQFQKNNESFLPD